MVFLCIGMLCACSVRDRSWDTPGDPRSLLGVRVGDRQVHPNLFWDFENAGTVPKGSTDTTRAHGGHRCLVFRAGEEYGPPVRRAVRDVAEELAAIEVGFWYYAEDADPRIGAVATIERDDGQRIAWFGKEIKAEEQKPGEWVRCNAEFLVRDLPVQLSDSITIYLWNKGRTEVFVDDLSIHFKSRSPLGTAADAVGGSRPRRIVVPDMARLAIDSVPEQVIGYVPDEMLPRPGHTVEPGPQTVDLPGSAGRVDWRIGSAFLFWVRGSDTVLIRPFVQVLHRDLLSYERLVGWPTATGLVLVGYDLDKGRVAEHPGPVAMKLMTPGSP
ncbi:MAG: hypothetical protein H6595_06035 [Flavobacteriales bacterium]|nr:hypothetical protein [Flavobacteriales bacterium]MCB9167025.1 hypothetical protein [Flavobacteriales bacterium]